MNEVPGGPHIQQVLVVEVPDGRVVKAWARHGRPAAAQAAISQLVQVGSAGLAAFGAPGVPAELVVRSGEGVLVVSPLRAGLVAGLWFGPGTPRDCVGTEAARVIEDLRKRVGTGRSGA